MNLVFVIHRTLFGMKSHFREEGAVTISLLFLLKLTLRDLVLAISLASGLQIVNPYLVPWFTTLGLTIPEESDYGTLLATVIGVGGVFIGLYYAAISTVSGAIYARVPNNIRDLLAQERFGNAYMRFLAGFTYFGVCLLAFHSVGLKPIILAIPLFLLGGGLAIIGFVRLGTRAFYLFDPTMLSQRLFEQLHRCHVQAQAGSFRWSDISFQQHAHKVANTSIDTLATVSDITAQEPHLNGRPFADLCKNLLSFLQRYETARKSIPTNSHWYEKRYVRSDWYRTSETQTSVSHQTATGLQPQSVSNPRWIESATLPIIKRCLETNIRSHRYTLVNELLVSLDAYVERLARERQVEFAFNVIRDVFSWCEQFMFIKADKDVAEESLEHMGICEQLARMPISVLIAYVQTVESYGRDVVLQRIHQITWKSEHSIYMAGFAMHVLEQLEWLRPRLAFEERVEGHLVSPPWYLQELIVQKEVGNLSAAMTCFYTETSKLYEDWIRTAMSSHHPWLAAVMISRESEYWTKLNYHRNALNQFWSDLNSDRRIKGLQWPELDTDELTHKKGQREKDLLKLMAHENILLSLRSRSEVYPDFAGQFLHTVGEALFAAMCENKVDMVDALFKPYLAGSALQFERLKPENADLDWQRRINLKVAVAPLLDLMAISGYAYLFSDYHDNPCLKKTIITEWNDYLAKEFSEQRLQLLAAAVTLTESAFELPHRSMNRSQWQQTMQQRLRDNERREVFSHEDGPFAWSETVVEHKSPLVRMFARNQLGSFYDGIDIFLAKYVRQRDDGKDLHFGRRRDRNFEDAIERENKQYMKAEES